MSDVQIAPQPWMPKVRLAWLFLLMTISALLIYIVQAADRGGMLAFAVIATIGFVGILAGSSALLFLVAYTLGKIEVRQDNSASEGANPFAAGQLPDQIIPPRPTEQI